MATDFDTVRSQYENYRFCYDNGHVQWIQRAKKCFDYWSNNQWSDADKLKNTRAGRPSLTLNVIESLVRSMKGIQRALRNDVRFSPVSSANLDMARVQDAVWMHIQQQNDFEFLETDVFEKGIIMGRAYFDVRVSYDESTQGEVIIRQRRSQDVILDPSVEDYSTKDWPQVYTRRWVSYNDIVNTWGLEKARAISSGKVPEWQDYEDTFMSQQMGRLPYYFAGAIPDDPEKIRAFLLLDRQYKVVKQKEMFIDMQTGDLSEVPEDWDRNRISRVLQLAPGLNVVRRKVNTVRWEVSCESELLHSSDSPYKSFTIIPYFPTFVDGFTMGGVEQLIDAQNMYNKITSQELHIINTTANSGYKIKKGSLQNMTIQELEERGSSTGFVAELMSVDDMEKFTPNTTPQGHDRLSFKADQIMRQLSGVSNPGRGFAREDVSADAIESTQAAQDINFAGWLSNLHRTKRAVAEAVQDCVRTHYTETRVIMINRGSIYDPKIDEITINQPTAEEGMLNDVTQGRYTTVLVPAPSRVSLSEADFSLLLKLRTEIGVAIPDSMLIELSPASNKAQIIQSLTTDSNDRQRAAEEAAAAEAAVEAQLKQAQAIKEQGAAALNQARAEKALVEANSDPDASYERVENRRMDQERAIAADKHDIERERLDLDREQGNKKIAVELTKIDSQQQIAKENAKSKAKDKPKTPPKKGVKRKK